MAKDKDSQEYRAVTKMALMSLKRLARYRAAQKKLAILEREKKQEYCRQRIREEHEKAEDIAMVNTAFVLLRDAALQLQTHSKQNVEKKDIFPVVQKCETMIENICKNPESKRKFAERCAVNKYLHYFLKEHHDQCHFKEPGGDSVEESLLGIDSNEETDVQTTDEASKDVETDDEKKYRNDKKYVKDDVDERFVDDEDDEGYGDEANAEDYVDQPTTDDNFEPSDTDRSEEAQL